MKRVPRPSHFKPAANVIPQDRRTKLGLSAEQAAFHEPGSGIVVQGEAGRCCRTVAHEFPF
ncbi:MAG: hypothetical protein H8K07_00060 [Nitrospira sp.]|nr:hypothetical protein [Nitrospira sp.]